MSDSALQGIRAIELGQGVSAPFCAKLLADYGMQVWFWIPYNDRDITTREGMRLNLTSANFDSLTAFLDRWVTQHPLEDHAHLVWSKP